ncbi:hypothetical protein FNH05_24475 [Amycolatopsis rhizosphaerae]|uniref:Uncharacterized protein n=1 Tax=Amycolatopsis rhizosphaerae TaxID=2053003 RepID=A0A558BNR4_9PSEU|nr:hypothetical protein [Amycolatopsis rhizosphaerae]TVT38146.1 hypothetical protein FNH05_24475 [Amycolatopsis rhizosphaerae]
MTDELSLPPRRELPPEVRARLRADVSAGLADRPKRGRVMAVAAAVALLAGGAVAATQLTRPSHDVSAASDGGGGAPSTPLDRCWAAVQKAGKTAAVPDRSKWVTTFTAAEGDDVVEAFTAGGKPMFCETTATTATVSNPDARTDGDKTRLLFSTSTGLVAGVADASWDQLVLSMPDGLGVVEAKAQGPAHQFAAFTHTDPTKTHLFAAQVINGRLSASRVDLTAPPAPLVSVTDRAADRKSPAGQALGNCLAKVAQPPADADSYQPGALLESGSYQVVLGRNAGHSVACTAEPGANGTTYHLYRDTFIGQSIPVRRLSVPALGGKVPFIGIVPPSGSSMVADFGLGKAIPITVTNGTFAAWLPEGAKPIGRDGESWVRVETASTVLFNGYVPMK